MLPLFFPFATVVLLSKSGGVFYSSTTLFRKVIEPGRMVPASGFPKLNSVVVRVTRLFSAHLFGRLPDLFRADVWYRTKCRRNLREGWMLEPFDVDFSEVLASTISVQLAGSHSVCRQSAVLWRSGTSQCSALTDYIV